MSEIIFCAAVLGVPCSSPVPVEGGQTPETPETAVEAPVAPVAAPVELLPPLTVEAVTETPTTLSAVPYTSLPVTGGGTELLTGIGLTCVVIGSVIIRLAKGTVK
jgi:hypothetical protein